MKVTLVSLCPSEAARKAGRPALTPELLAASGARYSRNNEGLESILARIDPNNLEKSVDSIFRMIDYGHQSIADMVPVAMFMDGISIWLAYYVWTLCPTAGGQESSTRYLELSNGEIIAPETLGLPAEAIPEWRALMQRCFEAYRASLGLWEKLARANPEVMKIPDALLNDSAEAAQKKVMRMRRNYAFDRARYFLPVSAATNMMLVMSARGWVNLCQYLLSHPLLEARRLGESVREELKLAAPRMLKHATRTEANQQSLAQEFDRLVALARSETPSELAKPFLSVLLPPGVSPADVAQDLAHHNHRYAPFGSGLARIAVRFGWEAIGFAEIRDLNRHRTGTKYCPQVPRGFYFALDQMPVAATEQRAALLQQAEVGRAACAQAHARLCAAEATCVCWSVLGTQYHFEHTTTANRFIYEAELRTGLGAHFRYAKHLRDVLALWYEQFPATRGLVLEGNAEPE